MTNTLVHAYNHVNSESLLEAVELAIKRLDQHNTALHYAPIYGWDNYILSRTSSPDQCNMPAYQLVRVEWLDSSWEHQAEAISETTIGVYTDAQEIAITIETTERDA